MSEELEDDWFERAVAEDDGSEEGTDDDEADTEADDETGDDRAVVANEEREAARDREDEERADADETEATVDATEGDADSLFDEDFASALESVEVPTLGDDEPSGYGDLEFGFGGPDDASFDDEALESDLPRIDLGIEGLDRMIQGGIPQRSLMVAIGGAGTGKTTFGIQFLNHGLERGENAVYVTLEETRERVLDSATEKGFRFDEHEAAGRLAIVDVDPVEMANSLASIRSELPGLIEDFGASRLVLDSVSLLEMMYEDRARRRNEIFDFTQSLKEAGVTALLTSEASEKTAYASRYGIVEYLTDAVFVLQYVRPDDFRETRLAIEIQKIRDANHSRETKPYEITGEGIAVYQQANLF